MAKLYSYLDKNCFEVISLSQFSKYVFERYAAQMTDPVHLNSQYSSCSCVVISRILYSIYYFAYRLTLLIVT